MFHVGLFSRLGQTPTQYLPGDEVQWNLKRGGFANHCRSDVGRHAGCGHDP